MSAYISLRADTPNGRMRRERLKRIDDAQGIEFYARGVERGFVYYTLAF